MSTRTVAVVLDLDAPDELFPPQVEQLPLTPRGSYGGDCLVCGLTGRFALGQPPVCELCGEDLARARAHIARLREASNRRLVDAEAAFQLARAAADPADLARLRTVEILRAAAPRSPAARAQLHAYLTDTSRPSWAALIQAATARVATLSIVQTGLARCDRADTALDQLTSR